MHGDALVRRGAPVDLRVGLLADGRHHHGQSLRPRRIQQQKRKAPVAGNEAELHGYLITPRSLRSMNADQQRHVLAFQLLIFSSACVVFSLAASSSRKAFCSSLQPLRRESAPLQADLVDAEGLVLAPRRGQRKRQHVLRHDGAAADKGVLAHHAMLMHRAECAHAWRSPR